MNRKLCLIFLMTVCDFLNLQCKKEEKIDAKDCMHIDLQNIWIAL